MSELVVLTCASGKQCGRIVPLLYQETSRYRLRLVVHSKESLKRLQNQYPKAEVVQADLGSPAACAQILKDASIIYYVSPTFQNHEVQFAYNVIDASIMEHQATGSKLSHFILSSVIHPEIRKLLNHDRKRYIEEYLCESTLPYTILQPSHFADNAIGRLIAQRDSAKPIFMAAHDPDVAFSFSCLKDHAEVSVKIIQDGSKHFFATYQVVSTWPMKYSEYVQSIGATMGKTFHIERVPYDEMVEKYCRLVLGTDTIVDQRLRDGPERLLLYYNRRGIIGNPGVLEWLLGRKGTTPAELARQMIDGLDVRN